MVMQINNQRRDLVFRKNATRGIRLYPIWPNSRVLSIHSLGNRLAIKVGNTAGINGSNFASVEKRKPICYQFETKPRAYVNHAVSSQCLFALKLLYNVPQ